MTVREPVVAIVGRPNVGKSTLFNRVSQKRKSIVHYQSGITRDRIYEKVSWAGRQFVLIDTGGFVPYSQDTIKSAIRVQIEVAVEEADIILFMVDGVEQVTATDKEIGILLRESGSDVILVANKIDNEKREQDIYDLYSLGFGEPFPVSALSGRRTGDLLDEVLRRIPKGAPAEKEEEERLSLAIVGMPNVGKSLIVNTLFGFEKSIVTEIPGTTRDSIDSVLKYYGESIVIIDTAGLRKRRYIKDHIEYYSTIRTYKAIDRCHVAAVIVDAQKGFTRQDADIVRNVIDKKKGLLLIVNKWDLVQKDSNTSIEFERDIINEFKALEYYPILFVSALTKQRVFKIIEKSKEIYVTRKQRINTSKLNEYFQTVIDKTPPPAVRGKYIKIKYVTQVQIEPPVFVFFCNDPRGIKEDYKRFLENHVRKGFGFVGVPLTILFRRK